MENVHSTQYEIQFGRLTVKVDTRKKDCQNVRPHCHVYICDHQIGEIWFDPMVMFKNDEIPPELHTGEAFDILDAVENEKMPLLDAFFHNKKFGDE